MQVERNIVHLPTRQEISAARQSSRMLTKYAEADRVELSLRVGNGSAEKLIQ